MIINVMFDTIQDNDKYPNLFDINTKQNKTNNKKKINTETSIENFSEFSRSFGHFKDGPTQQEQKKRTK